MNDYTQIIKEAELAVNKGDYRYCIKKLKPLINIFPVSTSEGVNIRFLLITASSGINNTEEAIFFCRQLMKSKYSHIRDNGKSLLEILSSPILKTPESWNIKLDTKCLYGKDRIKSISNTSNSIKKEKFINTTQIPTGRTNSFQKGFTFFVSVFLVLMTLLLSGCVKIESNLDLTNIEEVNVSYVLESKFDTKLPWQLNLETEIKKTLKDSVMNEGTKNFVLKNKSININKIKETLNQFLKVVSESLDVDLEEIDFNYNQKNYLIAKRYFFDIIVNLQNLNRVENLELVINIASPSKVNLKTKNDSIKVSENELNWQLEPGEINHLIFNSWYWNKTLISTLIAFLIFTVAYLIRIKRYELGSSLPKLPS